MIVSYSFNIYGYNLFFFIFKSFVKDVDLETSHLSEVNDLILTLTERKGDLQMIRALEKKREDVIHDLLR